MSMTAEKLANSLKISIEEAKQVLEMDCDIQLNALQSIEDYPNKEQKLAAKLIQSNLSDWNAQLGKLKATYQNRRRIPQAMTLLD